MQDDVENRTVTLGIKAVKLTANLLKKAIVKLLVSTRKNRSTKNIQRAPKGKQTVKELIGQNQGVSNIEITDKNIKSFESVARKYGVDFAVKKVAPAPGEKLPTYYVFFKGRDADALTSAFKEYTGKKLKKVEQKRPSALARLRKLQAQAKDNPTANRAKNKSKEQTR